MVIPKATFPKAAIVATIPPSSRVRLQTQYPKTQLPHQAPLRLNTAKGVLAMMIASSASDRSRT